MSKHLKSMDFREISGNEDDVCAYASLDGHRFPSLEGAWLRFRNPSLHEWADGWTLSCKFESIDSAVFSILLKDVRLVDICEGTAYFYAYVGTDMDKFRLSADPEEPARALKQGNPRCLPEIGEELFRAVSGQRLAIRIQ